MFKKVLIANRGEIALRIHRACKEQGIKTVVVHSVTDSSSMHVLLADESICIGPAASSESYLNIPAIISAASITGADAIHPGIGFLSENAEFAQITNEHNITFIGPSPEHISLMGDKIQAKNFVSKHNIPVTEGSKKSISSAKEAIKIAKKIGYPVILKAAGGGGRGMRVVEDDETMDVAFKTTQKEALSYFNNKQIFMEQYLNNPRHIEIQIIADKFGNVCHLGERDCSLQRRHQKVWEEAPSPVISNKQREELGRISCDIVQKMKYVGVGTFEFLYQNDKFYFIEMNTRLQVEHPITEMITGIDLVREQIRVAAGLPLSFKQKDIKINGHAIECRINAEDPKVFTPSPGKVAEYHAPGGLGIRIESSLYSGYDIPPFYDNLIAKLIVHGNCRKSCLAKLKTSLEEYAIGGVKSTIALHKSLCREQDIIDGNYSIHWLEKFLRN